MTYRPRGGYEYYQVRYKTAEGMPKYRFYKADQLAAANSFARDIEREAGPDGIAWAEADKIAVRFYRNWEAAERAEGRAVPSLLDIVRAASSQITAARSAGTLANAAQSYIRELAGTVNKNRQQLVEKTLENFLQNFPYQSMPLCDISEELVIETLNKFAGGLSIASKRCYLGIVASVFARAIEQGKARINPAKLAMRQLKTGRKAIQPTYLKLEEVRKLLDAAALYPRREVALNFVIGLLTGIRLAERNRLQYSDLRLAEAKPYIFLPAGKAKTLRQRLVFLHGSHAAIIRAFMPARYLPEENLAKIHDPSKIYGIIAETAGGIDMPRNVLRHTAATYLCAHLESLAAAALQLGHSESVLRNHYRALVTESQGRDFFELAIPRHLALYPSGQQRARESKLL